MSAAAVVFWVSIGLLVYTQVGYPLVLVAWARVRPRRGAGPRRSRGGRRSR